MACENKTKAIVTWQWEGEDEQKFETKKPPVDVTLTPVVDGVSRWAVKNSSGEIINTFVSASYALYPNTTFGMQPFPGHYLLVYIDGSGNPNSQSVFGEPITVELLDSTGCRIDIFDETGKVFSETKNKKCPTYKIKCDDDCNEGEMKCECSHYPGYCCVPCSEIKSSVSKAASTLRQVRA